MKPPMTVEEKLTLLLRMVNRLRERAEKLEGLTGASEVRPYEPGDDDEDPQIYLPRG